jgi:hypothetical protein
MLGLYGTHLKYKEAELSGHWPMFYVLLTNGKWQNIHLLQFPIPVLLRTSENLRKHGWENDHFGTEKVGNIVVN